MNVTPPPLDASHRPQLRAYLSAEKDHDGFVLLDPRKIGTAVRLTPLALHVASRYFDGTRTLAEIHAALSGPPDRVAVPLEALITLANGLDEALLLNGPSVQALLGGPVRQPSCIGCYHEDPAALRKQLESLFTAPGGPGLPDDSRPKPDENGRLRAMLVPHIDYGRGNVCYGWGFKSLIESTDARLFVIVATSHYSPHRFTLTRQHFATPLGVIETDQTYINKLIAAYGDGLFEDEIAHVPEHSIELEAVLLQYLFEKRHPVRIVPLLVGSFSDCMVDGSLPAEADDVARMVAALRQDEAETDEPICYLISGDLAHIGPKFGDRPALKSHALTKSQAQDDALLKLAASADPARFYGAIAAENDSRRICGLPPTYLVLEALRPQRGTLLNYQQYAHPEGHESVSFASMAFYD